MIRNDGVLAGDDEIASEHEIGAESDGMTVDLGDDRLLDRAHRFDRAGHARHDVPVASGTAMMAVARRRDGENVVFAGDHDDAHAVVVPQLIERAPDFRSALRAAALAPALLLSQMLLDAL